MMNHNKVVIIITCSFSVRHYTLRHRTVRIFFLTKLFSAIIIPIILKWKLKVGDFKRGQMDL